MVLKTPLTNEKVSKRFKSQFELVNYAIKLAENMIRTGRDARVKTESQNRALQILGEIIENKDKFDEIPASEAFNADERRFDGNDGGRHSTGAKSSERRKSRKILTS